MFSVKVDQLNLLSFAFRKAIELTDESPSLIIAAITDAWPRLPSHERNSYQVEVLRVSERAMKAHGIYGLSNFNADQWLPIVSLSLTDNVDKDFREKGVDVISSQFHSDVLRLAFRYTLGRQTYATSILQESLKLCWNSLSDAERKFYRDELENAVNKNSAGNLYDALNWIDAIPGTSLKKEDVLTYSNDVPAF